MDDIRGIGNAYLSNLNFRRATGVSTDSRTVSRGQIFFALRGEKFDGHGFVEAAIGKGAACAVVDKRWYDDKKRSGTQPLVVVDDTTKALGDLARIYRRKFTFPVIAIGGSNGKTTTKEMTARVLSKKFKVAKTTGNHNNQIGVPMTIFEFRESHEAAVIEIGTNHFGEIDSLCGILEPNAGLITNIGSEHLEFFASLAGVRREEGRLFGYLAGKGGTAFLNLDDRRISAMRILPRKRIGYGFKPGARRNVAGRLFGFDSNGCAVFEIRFAGQTELIRLGVPGIHNAMNALAAASVGLRFGVSPTDIKRALETFKAYDKRMQVLKIAGVTILNDTYNSNPESSIAALRWLSTVRSAGKRVAVLADMLELGSSSRREHERIGREASREKVDRLFTFGEMAKHTAAAYGSMAAGWFDAKVKLIEKLLQTVSTGDVVLIKGSRGMKMEEVVDALVNHLKSGRTR